MSEEKKLTDDTEIDVGMIEKTLEIDDTIYVWLLKGSMWKTYNLQKILDLIHRLQSENEEYKRKISNGELMECIVIRPEDLGHNDPVGETGKSFTEQAVKDTAKEIFAELFYIASIHHSDVANILAWAKEKAKSKGVEVE